MHTLFLTSSYPAAPGDSTAPFMEEMAVALVEQGNEVTVLTPWRKGLVSGVRQGVTVESYRSLPGLESAWGHGRSLTARGGVRLAALVAAPPATVSMLRNTRRMDRALRPDVVHFHWLIPQAAARVALPRFRPTVATLHGADVAMAQRSRSARRIFSALLPRIDAVTSSSPEALEFAASLAPSASTIYELILPGADLSVFGTMTRETARSMLGVETEERIVLAVGRQVAPKGLDVLLRAQTRLPEGVRLVLIGDGPLMSEHEALAESQRRDTRLLGRLDRRSVALWMAAADVLAVPSVRHRIQGADTGPIVVLEALASACPVVATDVGLASQVIQDGHNGFVIPPNDVSTLANALIEVLDASADYSARAKKSFEAIGGWDRTARQLGDLYRRVVA